MKAKSFILEKYNIQDEISLTTLDEEMELPDLPGDSYPENDSTKVHAYLSKYHTQLQEHEDKFKEEFLKLAGRWSSETARHSSITRKIAHLDYLRIISKGWDVVPLILEELKREPDHWFIALHAITGASPAPSNANFDEVVKAWLSWGKERGLIN